MPDERQQYGGQAVVEGVMMRSPRFFAIACRRLSDGEIVTRLEPVENGLRQIKWLNQPFLRGSLALVDAMSMGIKAMTYAADVQVEDGLSGPGSSMAGEAGAASAVNLALGEGGPTPKRAGAVSQSISGIAIGLTTVLALVAGFSLFWLLPGFLTDRFLGLHGRLLPNLAEGGIRLLVFFAYLGLISRMAHVQRVFQYHGAEHKAINALEAGRPLTLESARESSRIHPRCGTNFIFIVLITSIVVFSVLPHHSGVGPALATVGLRLLLLPVVAGIAFEILKWAGSNRDKAWAQALIAPGLWTQYLTTRVPDDSQIEIALSALQIVWDREHGLSPAPAIDNATDEPAAVVA